MEYLYFLSLTFSRFDKKWYIVEAAVFLTALIIGFILVKRGKLAPRKMAAYVLFVSYIVLVLLGTVISRESQEPFRLKNNLVESWHTFFTGSFSTQIETLSNIILFIPFGYLLPMILGKSFTFLGKSIITLLVAMILTLTIELIQLITGKGLFETADIVSNIIGALTGIALFLAMNGVLKIIRRRKWIKKS